MRKRHFFSEFFISAAVMTMASPALSYEVSAVTGGGSIEGVIVYRGTVPTQKIIPTKDVEVCGDPREEPLIRVGANQAVESAVVYLVEVPPARIGRQPARHLSSTMRNAALYRKCR